VSDPHPVVEDPEEHIGEEMPDPWDDPNQTDWPTNSDLAKEVTE